MAVITNLGVAIYSSLAGALALFFSFIPRLIGFLVILLIGWIVAKALEKGITLLLQRVGFDRVGERIGLARMEQQLNMRMNASSLLGRVVFWFVFLIFLIPAFNALELTAVSSLLNSVISYVPNVFVAIIVLLLGTLLAVFAYDVVTAASAGRVGNPRLIGNIVRYAIVGFTVLVALEQLQIAPVLIGILFTAVVGGAALALGLSFGLGGRDTAQRLLTRGEDALSTARSTVPTAQYANQPFNQAPSMGKAQPGQPVSTPQPPPSSATMNPAQREGMTTPTEPMSPGGNMPPQNQPPYRGR
jgi:Small-conductance mechanosensitive channel